MNAMHFEFLLDEKHRSRFGGHSVTFDWDPTDCDKIEDAMLVHTNGEATPLRNYGGEIWACISDGKLCFDLETVFGIVQSWPDDEWDRPVEVQAA